MIYLLQAITARYQSRDTERGATLIEYALLISLMAIVCITAVRALGNGVQEPLSGIEVPMRTSP